MGVQSPPYHSSWDDQYPQSHNNRHGQQGGHPMHGDYVESRSSYRSHSQAQHQNYSRHGGGGHPHTQRSGSLDNFNNHPRRNDSHTSFSFNDDVDFDVGKPHQRQQFSFPPIGAPAAQVKASADSPSPVALRSGLIIGISGLLLLGSFVLAAATKKPSENNSNEAFSFWMSAARMKKVAISSVLIVMIFFWDRIKKSVASSKTQQFYDPSDDTIKTEHRTWTNAILILVQKTGLFPNDGSLYQFVASFLTKKFNAANNLFKDDGIDPVTAIIDFSRSHGISTTAIQPDGSADQTWLWSKQPSEYTSLNDFFMRRYAKYNVGNATILAPSTSVVRRYNTLADMDCMVKGVRYTLENCGIPLAKDYERYACFYFYLSPADYHCFHSPITGTIDDIVDYTNTNRMYSGSVKMDCLDASPSVLIHNRRYVVVIKHPNGFKLAMVIIGGFLVDSIRIDETIHIGMQIKKGQYLGAFALGGSAILMMTNREIPLDPVVDQAMDKHPELPTKLEVGQDFADVVEGKGTRRFQTSDFQ